MSLSRIKEAIIPAGTIPGAGETLDPTFGGQFGYSPRIGYVGEDGKNASEWISNQAYVRQNVIPILVQYPAMFDYMPNGDKLIAILKSIIELRPKTIDGLTSTLTLETSERPLGGSGIKQHEFVNVTIADNMVTKTYDEVAGKAINRFLTMMIEYGAMDPYTKHSKIGTLDTWKGGVFTADYSTFTVMYIEPDITGRRVEEAWLRAGMFPTSAGEVIGKRDLNSSKEVPEYSIEYTGFNMSNAAVRRLAQNMLDKMNISRFDSANMPLFVSEEADEAVDPSLQKDKTPIGF